MPKICFIHGRPGPHPFHRLLAESVEADFVFVDYKMRWHDRESSRLYRYASQLVCGALLPRRFEMIISEGPHSIPVIARAFRLLGSKPKAVALLDNETLYFLKTEFYSRRTASRLISLLSKFDAIICVGEYQYELANELLGARSNNNNLKLYIIHSSIKKERIGRFAELTPDIHGKNLLFIGNGPSGWRSYYKGLDVLLDSLKIVRIEKPEVSLTIVGEWEDACVNDLLESRPEIRGAVNFVGKVDDLEPFLESSALYVHPARGEAFGISIIEAMCAGLPCIVSNETGAKEAVAQVSKQMVVEVNPTILAEKILGFLDTSSEERQRLSSASRAVARQYTEERSIKEFSEVVNIIAAGE